MPVLSLKTSRGKAVVDVTIGASRPVAAELQRGGKGTPTPIQIRALIDPAAGHSCIEEGILRRLGLTPSGTVSILTPSSGEEGVVCNGYNVSLTILHPRRSLYLPLIRVAGCTTLGDEIDALLGQDLLARCLFVYDGPGGAFSLAFSLAF